MKNLINPALVLLILTFQIKATAQVPYSEKLKISVEWKESKATGSVEILNGSLDKITIAKGKGKTNGNKFSFSTQGANRLDINIREAGLNKGSGAAVITINSNNNPFSFFLRDITKEFPVLIPGYGIAVTLQDDDRTYNQIENDIMKLELKTSLGKIESEPEESFEKASQFTRNMECPTWLGISRDIRIFEIAAPQDMDQIIPRNAPTPVSLPEINNANITYSYMTGRGVSVEDNLVRRLENGVLPILNTRKTDGGIEYLTTTFVSLESSNLSEIKKFGTHYLVADSSSYGHMFTPDQKEKVISAIKAGEDKAEETVLFFRSEAVNTSETPRYAWFRTVRPGAGWWQKISYRYDKTNGFSIFPSGRVFGISKLNGKALPDEEIAILLKPGEKAIFEFFIPHEPIPADRAAKLAEQSFDSKITDCKKFWNKKLAGAAQIHLPEKRIEEMLQAGLLHLDLITYGIDPDETLAPSVGVYSPIGTESSPIIQFYSSMGLHDVARRSLNYFLDKQHDDGMIQNFGGYMVETGAALWSMGEYYRYSRDTAWVISNRLKLIKASEFLIGWRNSNKLESLRGKGYGMIDGKVADPEDPYHQYMLNGYAYLGLSRCGEMLKDIDPVMSEKFRKEAELWKNDIRESFFRSMGVSPVVPLGDGTWSPTVPPWTEATALRLLYLNPETFLSHGTFTVSDAMLGPLYLVFCEVIDPQETASHILLNYHTDLFYQRNAAFSQPYYSRHNWLQIKTGMVKPFLKTYYNTFSALADRETYTFWEHLYKVSVHKTHEEAWFLMETRWMLYLEDGDNLKLLPGAPRSWFENGKTIDIKNVSSYFGPVSFRVVSNTKDNYIEGEVFCEDNRGPERISFRIPHPEGKIPTKVTGGEYDPATESVLINSFRGSSRIRLEY
ncbi:MAG: hypothetical protein IPN68_07850 [Bacteroidetes bacterium]|nr:hypothetical protein [Bacteroidota bacterium]